MAAYVPCMLRPLCAALPRTFRAHLDALAHRGVRMHEPHAHRGTRNRVGAHTIPTAATAAHMHASETSMDLPEGSGGCSAGTSVFKGGRSGGAGATAHRGRGDDVIRSIGADREGEDAVMQDVTGVALSASRNLFIISKRDPENSPGCSEFLYLCAVSYTHLTLPTTPYV